MKRESNNNLNKDRQAKRKETALKMKSGNYIRSLDGVILDSGSGAKDVCSYIRFDANMIDDKSEKVSVRARFMDFRMQKKVVSFPRAEFNNPKRLIDRLLNAGFLIHDTRQTELFLTDLQQHEPPQKDISIVSSPGWHPVDNENSIFIVNGEAFASNAAPRDIVLDDAVDVGFSCKGDFRGWQNNVASFCQDNPRLIFLMCGGVSGPLLDLLGYHNIGIHIFGPSRAGKTTGLVLVCSIFGGHEFRSSWNATTNALQETAISRNDLALILDEISQCDAKQVSAAAYDLMNGVTKSRLGPESKLNSGTRFRLVVISTGEYSLQEHLQQSGINVKAGQLARLISIPVNPKTGMFSNFHEHATHGEFAATLLRNADNYHGTAGPKFIRCLVENQQQLRQTLPAQVSEIENSILESIKSDDLTELQRSIARSFAVIACAGELAISYEVFPWSKGDAISAAKVCFKAWNRHEKEAAGVRDPAFASLKQFFRDEHSSFMPLEQYTKADKTVHTHTVDGSLAFLVSLEHFERVLCREFGKAAGIAALKKRRLLVHDSRGGPTRQHMVPNLTKPVRLSFYVIRSSILTAE